ncbi:MAG: membrane protein insertion efficiency factor YidD [Planctomycetota bacterium]|nr:MAG: membrane protein insertion efficiency factor YidD [Planctomycetota bacterium]
MQRLSTLPIRFYRSWIRPWLGPARCRFEPSCSHFAEEAVEVHGLVKGSLLALARLLRCHPLCKGGFDPVPPRGRWRNRWSSKQDPPAE